MWNEEDRQWLYQQMQENGVDTGSYDEFTTSLENKEDRDWYYEKSRSLGLDVGSQEDFDGMMLAPSEWGAQQQYGWKQHSTEDDAPGAPLTHDAVTSEDARGLEKTAEDAGTASGKTAGAAIAGGEAAPRTQKPVVAKKQKGYKPSPSFLLNLHSSMRAYDEGSRRRKEQVHRMTMPATTEGRKELKTREFGVQLAGGKTKLAGVVPGKNNAPQVEGEGNESTAPTTGPVPYGTVVKDGKRVTQWMLPDGRLTTNIVEAEYAEGSAREARLAHAAERRANDPEAQVADADKLQSEIEEMLDEERQKLNDMAVEDAMENPFLSSLVASQGGDITDMRRYNKTDIGNLEVAKRTLEDTKRMVNEAAHNEEGRGWLESSFGAGLARGLWDNVTDRRTWDLGITDMQDATLTLSALDAFDKGKKLTPSQQKLLDAKATQIAIEAWASKNVGWGYDAGAVTAQAIPFMVEMCLNPAATTGELAVNKLARYVVKRYGKAAVKRNAKKYVAAKVATRVLGDIAGAGIMSATTGLGRVAAEAERLQQGDIKYDFLPDGRVTFGDHENAMSAGEAWGKAFVQHTIENQTEMAGAYFSAVGGVIGHVLSKTPLKKLGAYAAKWGRKITPESVIEFVKAVPKTEWAKGVKKFQKMGKYDGLFGEYGEEVLGNVENAIIYNDDEHNFGTGRGGVFNLEENLKTFVSLIPMQVVFGGVSSAGYWMRQRESRKRMEKLGNELRATMSEEDLPMFETLQSNILGNDNGAMVDAIYEALTRSNMSYEQRRLLLNYAKSAMEYKTISALDDEEMADTGEAARQVRLSYDAAYTREMDESLRLSELAAEKYGDAVGLFLSQEEIAKMDEDPIAWLRSEAYRALPGWRRRIAEKYINARASMVGAQDRVRDELEGRVDEASSTIDGCTNKSTGNVQRATMRHGDREVYVVDGDVTMLDDGSDVDKDASSESVIIKDAQTGRVEMVSIGDISSVDAPISAEDAKASAKTEIEAEMEDETTREQGGFEQGSRVPMGDGRSIEIVQDNGDTCLVRERVVDAQGNVTYGEATETTKENLSSLREDFLLRGVMALSQRDESEMLRFEVGEHFEAVTNDPDVVGSFEIVSDNGDGTVTYKNDAGEEFVAQKSVIQWAVNDAYERGLVKQAEDETQTDGAVAQGDGGQVDGVSQGAPGYALNDEVVLDVDGAEVRGMVTAEADEDGMIEVTTESPIGGKVVNLFSRDELDAMSRGRQGTSEDGIGQSAGDSTGSQMPTKVVDGKSRVDYMRATPQRGAQHIYDEKGYSEAEADEMVANTIAQKERAVAEAEQAVAEAQAELDAVGAERPTVALSEDSEDEYLAQKADIDRRRGVAQQKVASAQSALDAARHELTHWQAIRDAAQKRKAQSAEVQSAESTEGQGAEVRSKVEEEQPNKSKYELSNEVDENGRQFVLTSEGNLEFGEISADTGLPAAPILLSEGMITNPETNDGYGLVHIEARHGDQIRKAGYDSVVDFVEEVAKNYEVIREGNLRDGIKTYMLQLTDKHNNTLMVELSGDGTYWNINTAGIFKTSYGAKRNVVYNRHTTAKQSAETAEASLSGEQGGTTPSTSMNTPTQTSNDVSVGKGSENSATGKGESEKSGEGGDVISGKPIQGLEGRSEEEVLAIVRDHIEEVLSDEGVDGVTLKGMALHGSRLRGDAKEGSDLDVVVEFDGDMREDDMFNMLNADSNRLSIDGISVDINPIREDKSGTLERYMERSRKYDESKGGRERTKEDERGIEDGRTKVQEAEDAKHWDETIPNVGDVEEKLKGLLPLLRKGDGDFARFEEESRPIVESVTSVLSSLSDRELTNYIKMVERLLDKVRNNAGKSYLYPFLRNLKGEQQERARRNDPENEQKGKEAGRVTYLRFIDEKSSREDIASYLENRRRALGQMGPGDAAYYGAMFDEIERLNNARSSTEEVAADMARLDELVTGINDIDDLDNDELYPDAESVAVTLLLDGFEEGGLLRLKPHYRELLAEMTKKVEPLLAKIRAEQGDVEDEIKRSAAHFAMETPEEWAEFERRIPQMSDEELLAYMRVDGNGNSNKAHHPSFYDEYDSRHRDEIVAAYDKYTQQLQDNGTTQKQAEEMLADLRNDEPRLATEERADLLGQEDALREYIKGQGTLDAQRKEVQKDESTGEEGRGSERKRESARTDVQKDGRTDVQKDGEAATLMKPLTDASRAISEILGVKGVLPFETAFGKAEDTLGELDDEKRDAVLSVTKGMKLGEINKSIEDALSGLTAKEMLERFSPADLRTMYFMLEYRNRDVTKRGTAMVKSVFKHIDDYLRGKGAILTRGLLQNFEEGNSRGVSRSSYGAALETALVVAGLREKMAKEREKLDKVENAEGASKAKAVKLEAFIGKDDQYPQFMGVYHDPEGYRVASDTHTLIAERGDVPADKAGQIIDKNGKSIVQPDKIERMRNVGFGRKETYYEDNPNAGKPLRYANWQRVIPHDKRGVVGYDKADGVTLPGSIVEPLRRAVELLSARANFALAVAKTGLFGINDGLSDIERPSVVLKVDGKQHTFLLKDLVRFLDAASWYGVERVGMAPGRALVAQGDKVTIMQMPISFPYYDNESSDYYPSISIDGDRVTSVSNGASLDARLNDEVLKKLSEVETLEREQEDERGQGALDVQRTEVQKDGSAEEEAIERKAKADGSWMTAPNGERSRLAPRQWLQTRTKAFKKWFGDSKIVDENGEPLVVYRGDRPGRYVMDSAQGSFFSDREIIADGYAGKEGQTYAVYLDIKNPAYMDNEADYNRLRNEISDMLYDFYDMDESELDNDERWQSLREFYLNFRNNEGSSVRDFFNDFLPEASEDMSHEELLENMGRALRDLFQFSYREADYRDMDIAVPFLRVLGYDGIIRVYDKNGDAAGKEYITFDPAQVKSATDNNGDFSRSNPDIRYAVSEDSRGRERTAEESRGKKADGVVTRREVELRDALVEVMRQTGMHVVIDDAEGQRVLDAYRERVRAMGSRVDKRMADIAKELQGRQLTSEQQAVVDVFTGKSNNLPITIGRADGERRIIMRQGSERGAGTKYSVFKHYGTTRGYYEADGVLLVPTIIEKGNVKKKQRGNTTLFEYKYIKDGVIYTVLTEINNRGDEVFADFYTNKKASHLRSSRAAKSDTNTPAGVRDRGTSTFSGAQSLNDDANLGAKLQKAGDNASDIAKKSAESAALFDGAKKKFGVTRDIREAGYVLPDGTMLDFSGRHELLGADDSGIRGHRFTDHRAVGQIGWMYDENGDEVETGLTTDMPDFIERGAIRIDCNAGTINLATAPTAAQRKVLRELIARNGGDVQVDFGNGWDSAHYAEYSEAKATRVLGDIERYFSEGVRPKGDIQFFLTEEGEVYGFVKDGVIYLDPKLADAETAIHEYGHLWGEALRAKNPAAWARLRGEMEADAELMAYVKSLYPELEGDALIDEVFQRYAGKSGAERLRAERDRMLGQADGILGKAGVVALFDKLRRLLERFWRMSRDLFAGVVDGLDRLSGADFADMMLADLLGGFNPNAAGARGEGLVAETGVADPFYSNAARAVENIKQNKAKAEQWKAMLTKAGGIKAGEDKWMGLTQWLDEHKGETLTKEQVLAFVRENGVKMEERKYIEAPYSFESLKREYDQWLHDEGFDYAQEQLLERFGDDADLAFDDLGGELVIANEEAAAVLLGSEDIINSTRLDYTTEGLDNKREIAFVVPGVEPYQEGDAVHFGPENEGKAVMWVRFGETTDADGNRVLVIDEIQSNRHQDAREKGYEDPALTERLKQIQQEIDAATKEFGDFNDTLRQKYGVSTNYTKIEKTREEWGWNHRLVPDEDVLTKEEAQKWKEGDEKIKALRDVKDKLLVDRMGQEGVPAAPFEKNWHEVAMKRMLRLAAEEGFDKVAWTTGEQQAERYNLGRAFDSIERGDNPNMRDRKRFVLSGANMETVEVNNEGMVVGSTLTGTIGKDLREVVGQSVAEKMMGLEDGDMLEGEDLRIGGEGMKGFYDEILPRFMNKYGKKWGVKTGEVRLSTPGGEVMHSVDVNEAMRHSVLVEGQPLFQKAEDSAMLSQKTEEDLDKEYMDALNVVEKPERIEKLRRSEPVKITGEEIALSDDEKENKKSAQQYGRGLQGSYRNEDTGNEIHLQRGRKNGGVNEVLQHNYKDRPHLQSVAAIPQIIQKSILISSEANRDKAKNPDVVEYQHYVCGLKIGGMDYTVHALVAVDAKGNRYYDHNLVEIEKGKLLDRISGQAAIDGFGTTPGTKPTTNSERKVNDLVSLLQTNADEIARAEEKMRSLLDEMARRRGYTSSIDYQGSLAFNGAAPSRNAYFDTKEERKAAFEDGSFEGDYSLGDFVDSGLDNNDLEWQIENPIPASGRDRATLSSLRNLRDVVKGKKRTIKMYRAVDASVKEDSFRNGDWVTPSREYAERHIGLQDWNEGRIIEQEVSIDDIWWNGDDINEWGYDDGNGYAYKNTSNNRKLTDLVTRDGAGQVIPPSKRFDEGKQDVRYREGDGGADLEASDAKVKRTMQEDRDMMHERAISLGEKLGVKVRLVESRSELPANWSDKQKRRRKGWFDPRTGEVVIVVPNNNNVADVEATVLHEIVGHKGLRELFGKDFDTFLDNVFNNVDAETRRKIVDRAMRNGWDFKKATEEYLASLAESTDFENEVNRSAWEKIKDLFMELLRKAGIRLGKPLTDADLRYVLWRSYQHRVEKGAMGVAEDVVMRESLGIDGGVRYREDEGESEGGDAGVRYTTARDRAVARDAYERSVRSVGSQFREAMQDSMQGLKALMKSILGSAWTNVDDVPMNENAYVGENLMSSVTAAQQQAFYTEFMKPLLEEVSRLCKTDAERDALTNYLLAKHGLERNLVFAERDAREAEDAGEDYNDAYARFRERDYSGLTALTGEDSVAAAESAAQQMVDAYEANHDTSALWDKIRAATKVTLEKQYRAGMLSKKSYDEISDMFEYYVPLRGFAETTSDEVYGYLTSSAGPFLGGSIIKHAEGRKSKADDPIATIAMMGDDSVRTANRNLMKRLFLNFVLNHPSDAVSVNELWLQKDAVSGEWVPVFPDIPADATADEVEQIVSQFEQDMATLAAQSPDDYKHGRDAVNIPYRVLPGNEREHQVLVKVGGRTYVLTINGTPRAAQALNGLTNPNVPIGGAAGFVVKAGEAWNRLLSALYTTLSPAFIVSNFLRDTAYSNQMVWVRESPNYALRFNKNYLRVNPIMMRVLFGKWVSGTLDDSKPLEKHFREFMLNGGETGYAMAQDINDYKKKLKKELRNYRRSAWLRGGGILFEQYEMLGRAVENCARFAAYLTSREMGRSAMRSAYDAKEISVNFNKKGAGGKTFGMQGQSLVGNVGALISGLGRILFTFWNAGVQGMANFGRGFKRHPFKAALLAAGPLFTMGALAPVIARLMGAGDGDDDDKDAYYNLPEYVRRSNVCIFLGGLADSVKGTWLEKFLHGTYLALPLPIEFRSLYGLGELTYGVVSGNERYSNEELAMQYASQFSQLLPIDMLEGSGGFHAFIPTFAKPYVEAEQNMSWSGTPIYRDSELNKDDPQWTKAFSNANEYIVSGTEWLNAMSGGDEYKQGWWDWNPAKIEYMLRGYLGGLYTFPTEMLRFVGTVAGARDFEWRNVPLANRVLKQADERTELRKLKNDFYRMRDEAERTGELEEKYQKAERGGKYDYDAKLKDLQGSQEYGRYLIYEDFKPLLAAVKDSRKGADEVSGKYLEDMERRLMRSMVDAIHAYDDGMKVDSRATTDKLLEEASQSGIAALRKKANAEQAKRLGGEDTYGSSNKEYNQIYTANREDFDLDEDTMLQRELKKAEEAGDTERAKRIDKARDELTAIRKGVHTKTKDVPGFGEEGGDDEEIMARLRARRKELLRELGITR